MPACNKLRIDAGDGSPVVDYRIEDDHVETRTVYPSPEGGADAREWQPLTREQLQYHITADTVVARWLNRRMETFPLLRAQSTRAFDRSRNNSWH